MKHISKIILIVIFSLIFINCGGSSTEDTEKVDPIAVKTAVIANQDIQGGLNFFGNIEGNQSVKVYSTIPNRVTNIYVNIGDNVKKGKVLATVKADKISEAVTQAEAALEAATAQYNTAEAEFRRVQKLIDENVVSQSHYDAVKTQRDAAKSNVKQAESMYATAQSQYQDTRITAPISGTISKRNYELGDMAGVQLPFFEIVEMNKVKVTINIIERHLGKVKPGQTANLMVNSHPDEIFTGEITIVNPTLDDLTRTARAEIIFDNPELKLKPGMFANVEVIVAEKNDVPVIPEYAIIEKTTLDYSKGKISTGKVKIEKYVFTIQDTIALKKKIETGIEHNNLVEVLSGIESGERLVTQGQHVLLDSSLVHIVD